MRSAPGEGGCGEVATVCIAVTPRWASAALPRSADRQGRQRQRAKAQLRRPCHPRGRASTGSLTSSTSTASRPRSAPGTPRRRPKCKLRDC